MLRFCIKNIRSYSVFLTGQDATLYHIEKNGWAEGPTLRWRLSRPEKTLVVTLVPPEHEAQWNTVNTFVMDKRPI